MSSKEEYEFLVVGHPRCGTGFMARVLGLLGYQVGHERMERDGTANWVYAVEGETGGFPWIEGGRERYHFKRVIHCVRDPWTAIASIAFTETYRPEMLLLSEEQRELLERSTELRRRYIDIDMGVEGEMDVVEEAIRSFLVWNRLIEQNTPEQVVRIEAVEADLAGLIEQCGSGVVEFKGELSTHQSSKAKLLQGLRDLGGQVNSRSHPKMDREDWLDVSNQLLRELDRFCRRYHYLERFGQFIT